MTQSVFYLEKANLRKFQVASRKSIITTSVNVLSFADNHTMRVLWTCDDNTNSTLRTESLQFPLVHYLWLGRVETTVYDRRNIPRPIHIHPLTAHSAQISIFRKIVTSVTIRRRTKPNNLSDSAQLPFSSAAWMGNIFLVSEPARPRRSGGRVLLDENQRWVVWTTCMPPRVISCFAAKRSETGFVFVKVFFFFFFFFFLLFQRFPYRKCIAIAHVSSQALFCSVP